MDSFAADDQPDPPPNLDSENDVDDRSEDKPARKKAKLDLPSGDGLAAGRSDIESGTAFLPRTDTAPTHAPNVAQQHFDISSDQEFYSSLTEEERKVVDLWEGPKWVDGLTRPQRFHNWKAASASGSYPEKTAKQKNDHFNLRYNTLMGKLKILRGRIPFQDFELEYTRLFETARECRIRRHGSDAVTHQAATDYNQVPHVALLAEARARQLLVLGQHLGHASLVRLLAEDDASSLGVAPSSQSSLDPYGVPEVVLSDLAVRAQTYLQHVGSDIPQGLAEDYTLLNQGQWWGIFRKRLRKSVGRDLYDNNVFEFVKPRGRYYAESWLRFTDAREGILPAPSRHGSGPWHSVAPSELRKLAKTHGAPSTVLEGDLSLLRDWLTTNAPAAIHQKLSEEDAKAILEIVVPDLLTSLRGWKPEKLRGLSSPTDCVQTFNQRLFTDLDTLTQLETAVSEGHVFNTTSNIGYLCGAIATANSLHAARDLAYLQRWRDWSSAPAESRDENEPASTPPRRITHHDILHAMFANYDEDGAQNLAPNTPGTPTDAFRAFLDQRIQRTLGVQPSDPLYVREMSYLTTINNFDVTALHLMTEFIHEQGLLPAHERWSMGVLMQAEQGQAAQAYVLDPSDGSPSYGTFFIQHDNAQVRTGGVALGHFTEFVEDGDMPQRVVQLGLALPEQNMLDRRRKRPSRPGKGEADDPKRKAALEKRNAKLYSAACKPCQQSGTWRSCDGARGKRACTKCKAEKVANGKEVSDCIWQGYEHEGAPDRMFVGNAHLQSEEIFRRWDAPQPEDERQLILLQALKCLPTPLSNPKGPWFSVVFSKRMSSLGPDGYLGPHRQELIDRLPEDHRIYNNLLNTGWAVPECQRPGGPHQSQMQSYGLVFARQGTLSVPTQLHGNNIADPRLAGFILYLHDITRPNHPNPPAELHIVTWGFAGLSTDINAFGSRHPMNFPPNAVPTGDGLIGFLEDVDRRNGNTHFQDNTYLVSLVNPFTVDGSSAASLAGANIDLRIPNVGGQFFSHLNKCIMRNKLFDLYDWNARMNAWANSPAGTPMPVHALGQAHSSRLMLQLRALRESRQFRGHNLGPNTVPTRTAVAGRNYVRNRHWSP